MSAIRTILFASAALAASVGFTMAAFGRPSAIPCSSAGIEARLGALENAAIHASATDPAAQHRLHENATYARGAVAQYAAADRAEACRFLDRMIAINAAAVR